MSVVLTVLRIRFLLLFCCIAESTFAFHIAGGDLTSRSLGSNNFEISLTLYRDCSNPNGAAYDGEIILSIYKKVDNTLYDTLHLMLDQNSIQSLQLTGAACVSPPQICMQTGNYKETVHLPNQPGGYYLVWERCCRNNTIVNIQNPQSAGLAFYLEIADPSIGNSSPVFNGAPTPFICAGQLFRIPFNATDADGDSLVYALSTPLDGGNTSTSSPNPFSPNGTNQGPPAGPYQTIQWNNGYNLSNVTGSSNPLTINSVTGVVVGTADAQGIYAMAVTVYEFRNGILIGIVRREIEFTVIVCIGNTPPNVSANVISKDYELHATDTLCFDVSAVDPNGDSLFMIHKGEVFSNMPMTSITSNFASGVDTAGKDSVRSPFCWIPDCNQFRQDPYIITYEISDNGCPLPLTVVGTFKIHVLPVPPISKQNIICMRLLDNNTVRFDKAPDSTILSRYFNGYSIYRSSDGTHFTPIQVVSDPTQNVFTDSTAFNARSTNYCYFLRGGNSCGEIGEPSDTVCTIDFLNDEKTYIHSVSVESATSIRIQWEALSDPEYRIYHLYRASSADAKAGKFMPVATLIHSALNAFTDTSVFTSLRSYCYTVTNEDHCGNESPVSDMECSILLNGEAEPYSNHLHWSPYINWKGGVEKYIVDRSDININIPYRQVFALAEVDTVAFDTDLNPNNGMYRYRIHALEGQGGESAESFSNEITLAQAPVIFIPNAFTPNDDTRNDVWGVKTGFIATFELSLFNRFGQLIWHTNDPTQTWDGTFNGQKAQEGVYCYCYRFTGYVNSDKYEKAGTVTLLR